MGREDALNSRIKLAGKSPCPPRDIDKALEILAMAESGEVSAFVIVGAGRIGFASCDWRTPMTRQDRLLLIGELQQQIHILTSIEMEQRNAGE